MANIEQLKLIKQGSPVWNAWRRGKNVTPDLSGANLNRTDLAGANFSRVDLSGATFKQANLEGARLSGAKLMRAFLVEANLNSANLRGAILSGADFAAADLNGADLFGAGMDAVELIGASLVGSNLSHTDLTLARFRFTDLRGANLTKAILDGTLFADVDLSTVSGLKTCVHYDPSIIDYLTLEKSRKLPRSFLRGLGVPEALIMSLPSIFDTEFYSCFISYSHKDEPFAKRIHSDLQQIGVRCWYAPHDMAIGDKTLDAVDGAIRNRDKVLLVLSKNSIASEWVEETKAFEEERKRKK
jgi:TIR domain/Pentapeptide repeats (8 copies)